MFVPPPWDNRGMDFLIVCLAALLASGLTLFSGFGLGTILTPVFALFFPVQAAVAMTALVHLANNLFKIGLVGRDADWRTVLRFGLPAALAALARAGLLSVFAGLPAIVAYEFAGHAYEVTPVKAAIGTLIVGFALLELSPRFAALAFSPRWLPASLSDSGSEASSTAVGTAFSASVSACTKLRFESNVPPDKALPSSNWRT